MHATVAQIRCMVPLYTMMISVVSVLRSSLTAILAQAPKQACITKGVQVWVQQDEAGSGLGLARQSRVIKVSSTDLEHHD